MVSVCAEEKLPALRLGERLDTLHSHFCFCMTCVFTGKISLLQNSVACFNTHMEGHIAYIQPWSVSSKNTTYIQGFYFIVMLLCIIARFSIIWLIHSLVKEALRLRGIPQLIGYSKDQPSWNNAILLPEIPHLLNRTLHSWNSLWK